MNKPKVFPSGSLKRIHVFAQKIRSYNKTKKDEAAIIVRTGGKSYHARYLDITDAHCILVQDLKNGMPGCRNARVWLETRGRVILHQQVPVRGIPSPRIVIPVSN
jgi:hypothetical protein